MTRSERGAQLREERQRQGLSTFKLAIRVRAHPRSIELAERGASSEHMQDRIARALRMPPAEESRP